MSEEERSRKKKESNFCIFGHYFQTLTFIIALYSIVDELK